MELLNLLSQEQDNALNRSLLSSLVLLENKLKLANCPVAEMTKESVSKLLSSTDTKKTELAELFTHINSIIDPQQPETEIQSLSTTLKQMGYMVNDSFWKLVEKDDTLEIYGPSMRQIYRNLNFYKMTGYSLLDLSSFEWFELYQRNNLITQQMFDVAGNALTQGLDSHQLNIPEHILIENTRTGYTQNFQPRAGLVKFRYISSLYSLNDKKPVGLVVTSKVSVLAVGDEVKNYGIA